MNINLSSYLLNMEYPLQSAIQPQLKMKLKAAAEKIGGSVWVVKAQAHTGGRGKAGGVKIAKTIDEVQAVCRGNDWHDFGYASNRCRWFASKYGLY